MERENLRRFPPVDSLLRRDSIKPLIESHGRETIRNRLRIILSELRQTQATEADIDREQLSLTIESRLVQSLTDRSAKRLQRVINATGVILHTNLGRARLSQSAIEAVLEVAANYSNLEYDLVSGQRGKRGSAVETTLCELFDCEAATIVNNCAAAVLVALNTLAEGGEVIVSRGEMIEIGGSFRIPDVIGKSGARMREVGTTNRTRLEDYEEAISDRTRAILRAHPSNYRIVGFTEAPTREELCQLASDKNIPLFEDLGSGYIPQPLENEIEDEPTVAQSLAAGVSLVAFSGDKLLGGPQAGIILGEAPLIDRIKRNPLSRAVRVDKLTMAALEATVLSYASGRASQEIPTRIALHATAQELRTRAECFLQQMLRIPRLSGELIDGKSVIGGGSSPSTQLPTTLIGIEAEGCGAAELETRLRLCRPAIIARIEDGRVVLDLRTVNPSEEDEVLDALRNCASGQ